MNIDGGALLGLVFLGGFFFAIVWAEVASRRRRRNFGRESGADVPKPEQPVSMSGRAKRDHGRRRDFDD